MRIVAGRFKGRPLAAPRGDRTRPTSDKAREALFNVLTHAEWAPELDGARIIDLFAGSGGLGFEAISRGGAFCLFVDIDAGARGAIRDNIEAFQLFGNTRLHRRSATDLGEKPAKLGNPFDLIFLDPPYGKDLAPPALAGLIEGHWVTEDALAALEVAANEAVPDFPGWSQVDERIWGAAKVVFLKRG
ncbi:16S rRNA (guanine(966)-N(2))-methyltransferase RsmD [Hyphobacterium sp. HN65]|uniref:16S rRNA (Guanine(966)-N(2))-methyltransferase RsmD n=1 Tax=Hyphobacterium lacteum TaxID=3116575 RepID=A0ABU7LN71_9PROT|nr:16S rRNA (guanine(966)-N(2))-methyltransferase RsmD [Hyphobacterium sp. HN65]MEE2525365.1 16S rRNA (guanine(966)-N(2))-methyltransferase RsmD [Hyphobacterium sp. HN65]